MTDTGMGIPARDLPHVFDKFYGVRTKATSEIAGTTFVVELPLVQTDAHPDHPR